MPARHLPISAPNALAALSPSGLPVMARAGVAFAGVGLLITGAIGVFVSTNSAGTAALVAAGLVLLAMAIYGDRITAIEGGGLKLQLQEAAASRLAAANEAEAEGDLVSASKLRDEAVQLIDAAQSVASAYEAVRSGSVSSWNRTARLESLVQQAKDLINMGQSPEAVEQLF